MKVENEALPENWELIDIGKILNVSTGSKNAQDSKVDGKYPFFTRSVNTQRIDCYSYDDEALLLAGEGIFIVKYYKGKFDVHQRTYIITAKKKNVSLKFLQNQIQSKIERLVNTSVGSTVQSLRKPIIQNLKIPLPPLSEQQKIADILSTVDEKIEVIDQQITATEEFKKGLMQRLLTKGIGHTEFKDSPIGKIPRSWEVKKLIDSDLELEDGDRGNNYPKSKDFKDSGYCLFLSAKNVTKEGLKFSTTQFINKEKDSKLRKGKLKVNDLVITTRGSVANIGLYDDDSIYQNVRINSGMAIIRDGKKTYDIQFLYYFFKSDSMNLQIESLVSGSAQPQLTIKGLKSLKIPVLSKGEQEEIAEILSNIDSKLNIQHSKLKSYQQLKKALMQQLLTGKVRVNNLIEA
ncbi:restriction endonuclease subunit S [Salegentibacter maritimus]|uniref:restriction endonuclease subunit S n=1 Tax=Salegentibacter maritimus TaxID=2794347 RepID=UPI0018E46BD0|nr:restriction endonuclease subunit S [Salegentibacter maritimus]MBI6117864.1 restriction endonuclease subunit S [Salegentibacter maritimus]